MASASKKNLAPASRTQPAPQATQIGIPQDVLRRLPVSLRELAARIDQACQVVRGRSSRVDALTLSDATAASEQTERICRNWLKLPEDLRSAVGPDGRSPLQIAREALESLAEATERLRREAFDRELRAINDSSNYVRDRFSKNDLDL